MWVSLRITEALVPKPLRKSKWGEVQVSYRKKQGLET